MMVNERSSYRLQISISENFYNLLILYQNSKPIKIYIFLEIDSHFQEVSVLKIFTGSRGLIVTKENMYFLVPNV